MPLAKIHVPQHLPEVMVKTLADATHSALVTTCDVPETDRFQLITRYEVLDMHIDPNFPNMERTNQASIIEIVFLSGRSNEKKRALYKAITKACVSGGVNGDDIMIALTENNHIDWSLGRGEAYKG